MGVARWWEHRRFGVAVHADLSSVPAWAPIGEEAMWYRAHLGAQVPDVLLHKSPLVETLAYHRDRWGHIDDYDDFFPFLTFDDHDPDSWASLIRDAGAGFAMMSAKHHDGLCWWDAPNTDRTVMHDGPARNVLGGFAAACERAGLVFGTWYSLLDWGDARYPGSDYVDQVLHPHIIDLVERYGTKMLWGTGHWGHAESHWRSDELLDRARRLEPELVVNDQWWNSRPDVRSMEQRMPAGVLDEEWAHHCGVGPGLGHNRNERVEHMKTGGDIVALLTEVVAKNGHLIIGVGPDTTGRIPPVQTGPLIDAGVWIRAHQRLVDHARPWAQWGDRCTRYLCVDGAVHAIDLSGAGQFEALGRRAGRVRAVRAVSDAVVEFEQHDEALMVMRRDRTPVGLGEVYEIDLEPLPDAPIELFPIEPSPPIELAPLLVGARPGDIVQLGDGVHVGPARVPGGVTLRGLGADRTTIDGFESCALVVDEQARVEHCTIRGGGERIAWLPVVAVRLAGEHSGLLGCRIDGHVEIVAADTKIVSCRLIGAVSTGADRITLSRSSFRGMNWDRAIDLRGGQGHLIDGCSFSDVLGAIELTDVVGAIVRGNRFVARWWGVHLVDTDGASVVGNSFERTMRAVDVDGGTLAEITGNAVADGDSGCIVERGASDTTVAGNRWERCRVGLLAWDAGPVRHHDNDSVDLHDAEGSLIIGP